MSEQNKARIRRVIEEAYSRGDLSVVDEVAASGPVPGTEWRPERPLPRGATYTWVVAAGARRFPQPPAPPLP